MAKSGLNTCNWDRERKSIIETSGGRVPEAAPNLLGGTLLQGTKREHASEQLAGQQRGLEF